MKSLKYLGVICALAAMTTDASAQGLMGKLKKAASKVETVVTETAATANESTPKVDLKKAPKYSVQLEQEIDNETNQPLLNEDGTPKLRAFLVDQNGNKRSPEAVKEQMKTINSHLATILAKVGTGAALGALSGGGLKSAAAGAATGAVASADDIVIATKLKKDLTKQKKVLEEYEANFTTEGYPKDAKADLSKIKNLDLDLNNVVSKSSAAIKEELENENFNSTLVDWDIE